MQSRPITDTMLTRLIVVFALLATGIMAVGFLYYDRQKQYANRHIQEELSTIAELKVAQIDAWRKERLNDATAVSLTGTITAKARRYFMNPGTPESKNEMLAWMRAFQDVYEYKTILLTDSRGVVRLGTSLPEGDLGPATKSAIREALLRRRAYLSDINKSAAGDPYLDLVAPLVMMRGKTAEPVGALLFRIDSNRFLYPFLLSWAGSSGTSETLLLRREHDHVVHLSEGSHNKDIALTLRTPLAGKPALAAALERGEKSVIEINDYREVPVIAAIQRVPDTGWFLAAKIDREEIYAPLQKQALLMLVILVVLIGTAGLSIVFWWRQKSAEHLRRQFETEEDSLRQSEAKYRELTDLLPQTVYEVDEKGNFTFINEHGFAAYGYTREDFEQGLNVLQLLAPADRERAGANIERRLRGEPMGQNEYTVLGRDGEAHSVLIFASPVVRNGTAVGLRGIVMDITDRKRTEKALQESEHRYKRLVESVTDYIYTVEVEKGRAVATYHGPGCVTVTGYTSEEFQASPDLWFRMIHEADRPRVLAHVESVLAGEAVPSFEHRIIHKDGSLRWVRNTAVPRHDENGRLIAYDGLITDETQLRLLENQLRQAQKMEAVGQLAGGVAHDFNNILTAIIGYANLLLMKMPEAEHGRSHVEQILASSERAAHLTHSLLAFSRKQLINLRPTDVNEVIKRVSRLLIRVIGEDIEFKTRLCDGDTTVLADSIHIEQVLMNLATNARDAMPDGGTLTIETDLFLLGEDFVRAHSYGAPGRYVLISVTDTGVGMEEAVRNRIFEPFFTTKEVGKGTGLGLAMVYGIVKQHNGYINVYSEPGRATTFKIYLPVIAAAADGKADHEAAAVPRGAETVLLAEDDDAVRNMTRNVLEDFGYKVIEAVDGEDAVRKFGEHGERVDLLVFDMIMPRKNGKEACLEIQKIRPAVRALFTSGYTADLVHKKGILEPGVNFIVKPSTPAALLRKVREVLDK